MQDNNVKYSWVDNLKMSFGLMDPPDENDRDEWGMDSGPELLSFPTGTKSQIALSTPTSLDDIQMPADYLKSGRAVLVNFHRLDKKASDNSRFFLTGVAYAVNGSSQKITDTIYVFTPHEVGLIYADELIDEKDEDTIPGNFQKRLFG